MESFNELDNKLYISKYINKDREYFERIWNNIKDNKELLDWAIKLKKDKFNERYLVNGIAICDSMLYDFDSVDKEVYNKLINNIYSNKDIARLVLDGYSNGGYSFLLMSLWNHSLKLTKEQKKFAVDEAMNKLGTTKYKKENDNYLRTLEEKGVSDEETTYINIDGSINPIGKKTKSEYIKNIFNSLSDSQAHGRGSYDIRYYILRNPNWTIEEKQKLIMDFWYDSEEYEDVFEDWKWGIVNDNVNYKCDFDISCMFDYTYEMILDIYKDKEVTDRIWDEIEFLREMSFLRPIQYESECVKSLVKNN